MSEQLSKRELWLMLKAFDNGYHYPNFSQWLNEMVCDSADVKMALEGEAPARHPAPEVEEMAKALEEMLLLVEGDIDDCGVDGCTKCVVYKKADVALAAYNQATEHLRR